MHGAGGHRARRRLVRSRRVSALLVLVVALVGTSLGAPVVPAGASGSVRGVTDDEIEIVALVADLTSLRQKGFNLAPSLTTEHLLSQWQDLADQAGKNNGRRIKVTGVAWDPLDATDFDRACTRATQDLQPFLVVTASGYRQDSIPCLTVDNNTPFFTGDPSYEALQKASGKNLLTLAPPAEVLAASTARLAAKQKLVPKSAKVGILSGNSPALAAAGQTLERELKRQGYDVVQTVELNTAQTDATAINRESAAAATTLEGAGADVVFVIPGPVNTVGFYQEAARANAGFQVYLVDTAAATCTQFGASRLPAEIAGAPCVTTWDTRAVPTADGVEQDNAFEAKCRSMWEADNGVKANPGVPGGGLVVDGVTLEEDMTPNQCTMMNLLVPAIKKAGRNLTWDKVYANLMKEGPQPAAYMSGGEGELTKGKPYFATKVHLQKLVLADTKTPRSPNGTYNGCPQPTNCFVPQLVDGTEWFPAVG